VEKELHLIQMLVCVIILTMFQDAVVATVEVCMHFKRISKKLKLMICLLFSDFFWAAMSVKNSSRKNNCKKLIPPKLKE